MVSWHYTRSWWFSTLGFISGWNTLRGGCLSLATTCSDMGSPGDTVPLGKHPLLCRSSVGSTCFRNTWSTMEYMLLLQSQWPLCCFSLSFHPPFSLCGGVCPFLNMFSLRCHQLGWRAQLSPAMGLLCSWPETAVAGTGQPLACSHRGPTCTPPTVSSLPPTPSTSYLCYQKNIFTYTSYYPSKKTLECSYDVLLSRFLLRLSHWIQQSLESELKG